MKDERLDEKIELLTDRLNKMVMVSELGKTDILRLAEKAYFNAILDGVGRVVNEAIDRYNTDAYERLCSANKILSDTGLEEIPPREDMSCEDVFNEYISRFKNQ